MGKSERLRLSDVRAAYRLVGECRDLGADPAAWRGHVASSLGGLTGSLVCMVAEAANPPDDTTPGRMLHAVSHGWASPRAHEIWGSYNRRGLYFREPVIRAIQGYANRRSVCSRDQAVDDPTWFGSTFFNETLRACELKDMLVSFFDMPCRARQSLISVLRPLGARAFRRQERLMIRLFHTELALHFGVSLATLDDPSPSGVAPRLHDTLRCLIEGDSEKQIAARLGLSKATVHQYVQAVYRHFRVSSRPELMAYFLRRSGFQLPERQ